MDVRGSHPCPVRNLTAWQEDTSNISEIRPFFFYSLTNLSIGCILQIHNVLLLSLNYHFMSNEHKENYKYKFTIL